MLFLPVFLSSLNHSFVLVIFFLPSVHPSLHPSLKSSVTFILSFLFPSFLPSLPSSLILNHCYLFFAPFCFSFIPSFLTDFKSLFPFLLPSFLLLLILNHSYLLFCSFIFFSILLSFFPPSFSFIPFSHPSLTLKKNIPTFLLSFLSPCLLAIFP